jgi:hypothetical protein
MTSTTTSDTIKNAGNLLQQTITTWTNLLEQSASLSVELLNSITSNTKGFDFSSMKMPMPASCGCKIPPPCWMPQSAGCVVSRVCSGTPAVLCIRVTNCGSTERTISFDDAGKHLVTFQPSALTLGPMETGTVSATLASSSSPCESGEQTALVWIRGCKEHYVRWTVQTVKRAGAGCCHEICVEDCLDFIHHWYDHFYCARPCPSQKRAG